MSAFGLRLTFRSPLAEKLMSTAEKQIFVTVSKDGPYLVSGDARLAEQVIVANADGESLQWHEGEACAAREKYALCRCGHSHTVL